MLRKTRCDTVDAITRYIRDNASKSHPICSAQLMKRFDTSGVAIRHMINTARSNGDPICSSSRGYYVAHGKEEIQQTIDSLYGRIAGINRAIAGLERSLTM